MRTYQPIWERIKREKSVTIIVHPPYEQRVKKAVYKEKDMDDAFKVLNDSDRVRLKIEYNPKTSRMTFKIVQCIGLEPLKC